MKHDIEVLALAISQTEQFENLSIIKRGIMQNESLLNEVLFYERKKQSILLTKKNILKQNQLINILNNQHKSMLIIDEIDKYLIAKQEYIKIKMSIINYITRLANDMLGLSCID